MSSTRNGRSIDGRMLIEEVNSYFGIEIESDDYDTIGGWIYSQVEMPPKRNQSIDYNGSYEFIIDETDQLRISRLLVRKRRDEQEADMDPEPVSV
jgi:CBS domain containing-hemolysin-like protein